MREFRADLHIHTVLSPCADLEMAPRKIVDQAEKAGLQLIGITDHNSTLNAKVIRDLAREKGILVLTGAEVTTKEEVHCLAFFENDRALDAFQYYLEENIMHVPNRNGHFGYQPVVDEDENVLQLVPYYLTSALKKGISSVQKKVYELGGIFIPAHVNRPLNGLFSHLGFIPYNLQFDAMGITGKTTENHVRKHYALENKISLIYNSDAHFLDQIGTRFSVFHLEELNFNEVKMALNQIDSRFVQIS
ncbi:PHP domain-containing protein [Draconibacterium sp. IB214405]|uniref:PHP domain-containing protein n=1 Tax=Draconibacterium sp. IB214405 TaxID=3097352 RepID=UPI002A0DB750|nr:PHP domain-containing protein [Draconibacterium sp. IB214405]MDX8340649.1 PHP domain-containing protein [Draconibacterium sp. IB214405]